MTCMLQVAISATAGSGAISGNGHQGHRCAAVHAVERRDALQLQRPAWTYRITASGPQRPDEQVSFTAVAAVQVSQLQLSLFCCCDEAKVSVPEC